MAITRREFVKGAAVLAAGTALPLGAVTRLGEGSSMADVAELERRLRLVEANLGNILRNPSIAHTLNNSSDPPVADGTMTEAKLADGAVTEPKIAALAVTEAKIDSAAVTEAKIADLAVTNAKIAALAADKITAGEITVQLDFTAGGKAVFADTVQLDTEGIKVLTDDDDAFTLTTAIYWLSPLDATPSTTFPRAEAGASAGVFHTGAGDEAFSLLKIIGYGEDAGRNAGLLTNIATIGSNPVDILYSILHAEYDGKTSEVRAEVVETSGHTQVTLDSQIAHIWGLLKIGSAAGALGLTIASGAVTISDSYHTVDTEAAAATDDLNTVTLPAYAVPHIGHILVLRAANSSRTVVCKDGTGNMKLAGDMTLDNTEDTLTLLWSGNVNGWLEIARSSNGA